MREMGYGGDRGVARRLLAKHAMFVSTCPNLFRQTNV